MPDITRLVPQEAKALYYSALRPAFSAPDLFMQGTVTHMLPSPAASWGEPFVNDPQTRERLKAIGLDPDTPEGRLFARRMGFWMGKQPSTGLGGDIAGMLQGAFRSAANTVLGILDLPLAAGRAAGVLAPTERLGPLAPFQHEVANPVAAGLGSLASTLAQFALVEGAVEKGIGFLGSKFPAVLRIGRAVRKVPGGSRLLGIGRSAGVFSTFEFAQPGDIEERLKRSIEGARTGAFLSGLAPLRDLPIGIRVPWSAGASYLAFGGEPVVDAPVPTWLQHAIFGGGMEALGYVGERQARAEIRRQVEKLEKALGAVEERKKALGPADVDKATARKKASVTSRRELVERYDRVLQILSHPSTREFLTPGQVSYLTRSLRRLDPTNPDPQQLQFVEKAVLLAARRARESGTPRITDTLDGLLKAVEHTSPLVGSDKPHPANRIVVERGSAGEDVLHAAGEGVDYRKWRVDRFPELTTRMFKAFSDVFSILVPPHPTKNNDYGFDSSVGAFRRFSRAFGSYVRKAYGKDVPITTQFDVLYGPFARMFLVPGEDGKLTINEALLKGLVQQWDRHREVLVSMKDETSSHGMPLVSRWIDRLIDAGDMEADGESGALREYFDELSDLRKKTILDFINPELTQNWFSPDEAALFGPPNGTPRVTGNEPTVIGPSLGTILSRLADAIEFGVFGRGATYPDFVDYFILRPIVLAGRGNIEFDKGMIGGVELAEVFERLADDLDPVNGVLPIDTDGSIRQIARILKDPSTDKLSVPDLLDKLGMHAFYTMLDRTVDMSMDPVLWAPAHRRLGSDPVLGDLSIYDALSLASRTSRQTEAAMPVIEKIRDVVLSSKDTDEAFDNLRKYVEDLAEGREDVDPEAYDFIDLLAALLNVGPSSVPETLPPEKRTPEEQERIKRLGLYDEEIAAIRKTARHVGKGLVSIIRQVDELNRDWDRYKGLYDREVSGIPDPSIILRLLIGGNAFNVYEVGQVERMISLLTEGEILADMKKDYDARTRFRNVLRNFWTFLNQIVRQSGGDVIRASRSGVLLDPARRYINDLYNLISRYQDFNTMKALQMTRQFLDVMSAEEVAEISPAATERPLISDEEFRSLSEAHSALLDKFLALRKEGALNDIDVTILKEVFRDIDARFASQIEFKGRGAASSFFVPAWGWITIGTRYHDGMSARVLLHELGHAYYQFALSPEEQRMVNLIARNMYPGPDWFMHSAYDANPDHYVENGTEFFAQMFAEYMLDRAVGKQVALRNPHLKAIFDEASARFSEVLNATRFRGHFFPMVAMIEYAVRETAPVTIVEPWSAPGFDVKNVSVRPGADWASDPLSRTMRLVEVWNDLATRTGEKHVTVNEQIIQSIQGGRPPGAEIYGPPQPYEERIADLHDLVYRTSKRGDADLVEEMKVRVSAATEPRVEPDRNLPEETKKTLDFMKTVRDYERTLTDLCSLL